MVAEREAVRLEIEQEPDQPKNLVHRKTVGWGPDELQEVPSRLEVDSRFLRGELGLLRLGGSRRWNY